MDGGVEFFYAWAELSVSDLLITEGGLLKTLTTVLSFSIFLCKFGQCLFMHSDYYVLCCAILNI